MTSANILYPKTMIKKGRKVLHSTFGGMNHLRPEKGTMLTYMIRSPFNILFPILVSCNVKRLSIKHYIKTHHHHGPYDSGTNGKNVRSTRSVKRQKESVKKSISDRYPTIVQQAVQQQVYTLAEALDNGYASWSCWTIIGCGSKMLFLLLSICLLTDSVLWAFLYHCRMVHDVGGLRCNAFWKVYIRELQIDGDWTCNDGIEFFTRLWINS